MKEENKGIMYAIATVILWSTLGLTLKLSVNSLDDFSVAFWIGLLTVITFGVYIIIQKKIHEAIQELKKHWIFLSIAGIIGLGIQQITYIKAYSFLSASETIILFYMYPILIMIIALFLDKEKSEPRTWLFILLGFFGVYLTISKGNFSIPQLGLGMVLALFASLTWAIFSYMLKKNKSDDAIAMFWYSLFGLLFILLCTPFFKITYSFSLPMLGGLLYTAIIPTALAFYLWSKALRNAKTSVCSNIALLTPLASLILISIVLKETILFIQMIGLIIVLGSVGMNIYLNSNKN